MDANGIANTIAARVIMTNKSNSYLARYAVVSEYSGQFAWFVSKDDAKDFIKAINGDPNYYSIEEVDG